MHSTTEQLREFSLLILYVGLQRNNCMQNVEKATYGPTVAGVKRSN